MLTELYFHYDYISDDNDIVSKQLSFTVDLIFLLNSSLEYQTEFISNLFNKHNIDIDRILYVTSSFIDKPKIKINVDEGKKIHPYFNAIWKTLNE